MFGIDTTEFIIVAIAALLFIGPKDLPQAMRTVGRFIGKIRGMARHFNAGIESMMREAELEEMEKTWREQNERIMREYPAVEDQAIAAEDQAMLPLDPPGHELPPEQRELP
ncbi:MAG TPA: Sec-independent protein translocase protein TatB [Sphingomicrobium sp.]|jgi:sec-independent protein translocase protein TatB|nr:Sec-independent protein translocase protein TatB [Sphingomicrobium sp.]HXH52434.1 Sec-independent protein translocase protein TatB [Sphingomicrobium sp.]